MLKEDFLSRFLKSFAEHLGWGLVVLILGALGAVFGIPLLP